MEEPFATSGAPEGPATDPDYALPRAQEEYDRLSRQAAFLGGTTERLFRAAGIAPGMRVLDVGSGAGDVALLAAELVGSDGEVIGIDVDGSALEVARGRAESLGLRNVTFVQGDARTAGITQDFDAAVGRLVLMYLADPADALRHIAGHVRPGGVVVFQELDLNEVVLAHSLPAETLWSQTGRLLVQTFLQAGMQARMGRRLFGDFVAAGLATPEMRDEALTGGGPNFQGYAWLAGLARGLAPLMGKLAIADVAELELDTLALRIREDAIAHGAVVWTPSLVGAYASKPDDKTPRLVRTRTAVRRGSAGA